MKIGWWSSKIYKNSWCIQLGNCCTGLTLKEEIFTKYVSCYGLEMLKLNFFKPNELLILTTFSISGTSQCSVSEEKKSSIFSGKMYWYLAFRMVYENCFRNNVIGVHTPVILTGWIFVQSDHRPCHSRAAVLLGFFSSLLLSSCKSQIKIYKCQSKCINEEENLKKKCFRFQNMI